MNISKTFGILLLIMVTFQSSIITSNDEYVPAADVMPTPVGGMKAIYKKIEYPEHAKRNAIQGKVYVMVYVNEDGTVHDVKIIKGLGYGCNEVVIEAIKKTKFNPGEHKGNKLKVKYAMPIVFKLE